MADNDRFAFGENWRAFLKSLTPERIRQAETSLRKALGCQHLNGLRFLDAGSGSGLFSLAARRLGADVYSFDFDAVSVACTSALKQRYDRGSSRWRISQGSVLDSEYMTSLGQFDVIYSWGVLHHTGDMWMAFDRIQIPAKKGTLLYIAIYNDQGILSRVWHKIKKLYVNSKAGRWLVITAFVPLFFFRSVGASMVKYRNPTGYFKDYRRNRGMAIWHDWIDWLGGYPFEVASPEAVIEYFQLNGFMLKHLKRTNRLGCNEFVFQKTAPS